jgi:sigma-B regulation protein RsbU (phosphoserine phosphatase)
LFDFFLLESERLGFVIGDVSGKGFPAALFMAVSRTLLRATAQHQAAPGECFTYVGNSLYEQNVSSMFVTLFYGVLNLRTGELQYANGGHNPAFVFAADGSVMPLKEKSGPVVGIFEGVPYYTYTGRLHPGEGILLYTDGITEARSKYASATSLEEFGDQRLIEFLAEHASEPVENITAGLLQTVQEFAAGAPAFDDMTVLALRYRG